MRRADPVLVNRGSVIATRDCSCLKAASQYRGHVRAALATVGVMLAAAGSFVADQVVARIPADQAEPCARDALPVVRVAPRRGPVGTRIRVSGRCFEPNFDSHRDGYGVFLLRQFRRPRECELLAGDGGRFRADGEGTARGSLRVSSRGSCFQRHYGRRLTPGRYWIHMGCHACRVGSFRVTVAD
jgi:hypothetical protein